MTLESIRLCNRLIPYRQSESMTARSDKLARAVLQKFLGPEWCEEHVDTSRTGFLRYDNSSDDLREQQRMRRIVLAEMLYNLQKIRGFRSCLVKLHGGDVEATYGALEIGRLLWTQALDRDLSFRFVPESGVPSEIAKRDYDLSINFSDGATARAETKCKQEETKITLRTIEASISKAKSQLPERVPGIVFVKVPRNWIDDETFVAQMQSLADRSMARSPFIVSVKFYTVRVVQEDDALGQHVSEIIAVHERMNPRHKFRKYKGRDWTMFPSVPGPPATPRTDYNGMPVTWQRVIAKDADHLWGD